MEIKKSSKANLEKDISLNYLIGIVVGLAILFVGFEWGEKEVEIINTTGFTTIIEEEQIEASIQDEPPPPPPVAEPVVVKEMEVINIVEDNIVVEQIVFTSEDDASHAQVETYVAPVVVEEEEEDVIYAFFSLEKKPEFPGGESALISWLTSHTVYPPIASEQGIFGTVRLQFVVEPDGSVSNVQITRGVHVSLDREAERVVKMLPKFIPGEQRGKPVRVRYDLPVKFQLQ